MNANELAEKIQFDVEPYIETDQFIFDECANMLRQQQAEIEALKKDNKELHAIAQGMAMAESDARKSLQWFKDAKERQSEPVAWMRTNKQWRKEISWVEKEGFDIPLYTHPANKKVEENTNLYKKVCNCTKKLDLTDEEIAQAWAETKGDILHRLMPFARAILRKAQEK